MHLFLGLYWHSQKSYDALAKHLRFEHMDAHYVGNMLANCPNLGKSDLFPTVMSIALSRRGVDPALLEAQGVPLRVNRGLPPGEAEWALEASLPLSDLDGVSEGAPLSEYYRCIGAAAGYPVGMTEEQGPAKGKAKARTFGLKFCLKMYGESIFAADPRLSSPGC